MISFFLLIPVRPVAFHFFYTMNNDAVFLHYTTKCCLPLAVHPVIDRRWIVSLTSYYETLSSIVLPFPIFGDRTNLPKTECSSYLEWFRGRIPHLVRKWRTSRGFSVMEKLCLVWRIGNVAWIPHEFKYGQQGRLAITAFTHNSSGGLSALLQNENRNVHLTRRTNAHSRIRLRPKKMALIICLCGRYSASATNMEREMAEWAA